MTDINTAAEALTGEWVKLNRKEHGTIEGRVLSFEQRPMTFEGAPVLNRKTGAPRTEWVLAVQTDGGDTIKFSLKEAGQRAISDAIKTSGNLAKNGDRLKIAVIADPMSDREQATYQARWTADNTPLDIPSDDEAPF
jgi:hypothetical protein